MAPLPESLTSAVLPPALLDVVRALQDGGFEAYLVGGGVRDLLRGKAPKDFDVATSARPEQVQKLFRKVIPTGLEHGTVTVMQRGLPIEVTTYRSEGEYKDGRRPSSVSFDTDIQGDLSRRDFTVNAIAYDPVHQALVDPFDGQTDLAERRLRAVGEAAHRFAEDGLRALRAIRFAAVLGFELEASTKAAIPGALEVFRKVSLERVKDELTKLLLSERPSLGVGLLDELGILGTVLPPLADLTARREWIQRAPADLELRLALLLHGEQKLEPLLLGLKFPGKVASTVAGVVGASVTPETLGLADAQLRRWAAHAGEQLPRILASATARGLPGADALARRMESLLASHPPLRTKDLALDGGAIMKVLGVGPSPAVGQASRFLMEQVLDHPEWNTRERLTELLAGFGAGGRDAT